MKRIALTLLIGIAVVLPPHAFADRMPLPVNTPASYKAECGSCHLAFPPALLSANDWRRTVSGLKDHFGTDAAVDGKNGQEIVPSLNATLATPASWAALASRRASPRPPASSASIGRFQRKPGKTRASNRQPIAKPAIAARPRAITANTTSAFLN
jgi:hypothetical protein